MMRENERDANREGAQRANKEGFQAKKSRFITFDETSRHREHEYVVSKFVVETRRINFLDCISKALTKVCTMIVKGENERVSKECALFSLSLSSFLCVQR